MFMDKKNAVLPQVEVSEHSKVRRFWVNTPLKEYHKIIGNKSVCGVGIEIVIDTTVHNIEYVHDLILCATCRLLSDSSINVIYKS